MRFTFPCNFLLCKHEFMVFKKWSMFLSMFRLFCLYFLSCLHLQDDGDLKFVVALKRGFLTNLHNLYLLFPCLLSVSVPGAVVC